MDIEGFEVPLLGDLRDWHTLPRQLSIELHFHYAGFSEVAPASQVHMALLVSHLAQLGYGPVFREGERLVALASWTSPALCTHKNVHPAVRFHRR